jgi:hypothetical protein
MRQPLQFEVDFEKLCRHPAEIPKDQNTPIDLKNLLQKM